MSDSLKSAKAFPGSTKNIKCKTYFQMDIRHEKRIVVYLGLIKIKIKQNFVGRTNRAAR